MAPALPAQLLPVTVPPGRERPRLPSEPVARRFCTPSCLGSSAARSPSLPRPPLHPPAILFLPLAILFLHPSHPFSPPSHPPSPPSPPPPPQSPKDLQVWGATGPPTPAIPPPLTPPSPRAGQLLLPLAVGLRAHTRLRPPGDRTIATASPWPRSNLTPSRLPPSPPGRCGGRQGLDPDHHPAGP